MDAVLSDDIIIGIAKTLPIRSVRHLILTCWRFRHLLSGDPFWRALYEIVFKMRVPLDCGGIKWRNLFIFNYINRNNYLSIVIQHGRCEVTVLVPDGLVSTLKDVILEIFEDFQYGFGLYIDEYENILDTAGDQYIYSLGLPFGSKLILMELTEEEISEQPSIFAVNVFHRVSLQASLLPTVSLPSFPSLPSISFPVSFSSLTFPLVLSRMRSLSVPSLPVSLSSVGLPSVNLSQVSLSSMSLPSMSFPSVSFPNVDLSSVSIPSVSLPDVHLPHVSFDAVQHWWNSFRVYFNSFFSTTSPNHNQTTPIQASVIFENREVLVHLNKRMTADNIRESIVTEICCPCSIYVETWFDGSSQMVPLTSDDSFGDQVALVVPISQRDQLFASDSRRLPSRPPVKLFLNEPPSLNFNVEILCPQSSTPSAILAALNLSADSFYLTRRHIPLDLHKSVDRIGLRDSEQVMVMQRAAKSVSLKSSFVKSFDVASHDFSATSCEVPFVDGAGRIQWHSLPICPDLDARQMEFLPCRPDVVAYTSCSGRIGVYDIGSLQDAFEDFANGYEALALCPARTHNHFLCGHENGEIRLMRLDDELFEVGVVSSLPGLNSIHLNCSLCAAFVADLSAQDYFVCSADRSIELFDFSEMRQVAKWEGLHEDLINCPKVMSPSHAYSLRSSPTPIQTCYLQLRLIAHTVFGTLD